MSRTESRKSPEFSFLEDFKLKRNSILSVIEILEILRVPDHTIYLAELMEHHKGDFFESRNATQILRPFFTDLANQPKALIRYLRYSKSWMVTSSYFDHFNQLQLIARLPKLTINGRVLDGPAPGTDMLPWKFPQIVDATDPLFEDSNSFALRLGLLFDTKVPTLLPDENNKEPDLLAVVNFHRSGREILYCYESGYVPFEVAIRLLDVAFRMENRRKRDD
jgi:hypothetical protein